MEIEPTTSSRYYLCKYFILMQIAYIDYIIILFEYKKITEKIKLLTITFLYIHNIKNKRRRDDIYEALRA